MDIINNNFFFLKMLSLYYILSISMQFINSVMNGSAIVMVFIFVV